MIDREFAKKNIRHAGRVSAKVINKIAVVALVGALLFTGAFATSETFRVNTLNLLLETLEDSTKFSFVSDSETEDQSARRYTDFEIGWLPDGFELTEQKSSSHSLWANYEKADGDILHIDLSYLGNSGMSIDTEDAEIESLELNGYEVTLITKDYIQAVMAIPEGSQLLCVVGEGKGITADDVLRVVENITLS